MRELTRVAAPETETEWLEATDGKAVRQIEKLVLGKKLGDRPSDPKRPALDPRVVTPVYACEAHEPAGRLAIHPPPRPRFGRRGRAGR